MKKQKKKTREIKPLMKFNTAFKKYEPDLPLKNSRKKFKIKIVWKWLIFFLIILLIIFGLLILESWLMDRFY